MGLLPELWQLQCYKPRLHQATPGTARSNRHELNVLHQGLLLLPCEWNSGLRHYDSFLDGLHHLSLGSKPCHQRTTARAAREFAGGRYLELQDQISMRGLLLEFNARNYQDIVFPLAS